MNAQRKINAKLYQVSQELKKVVFTLKSFTDHGRPSARTGAARIRTALSSRPKTRKQLAKESDVSLSHVSNWISNHRNEVTHAKGGGWTARP